MQPDPGPVVIIGPNEIYDALVDLKAPSPGSSTSTTVPPGRTTLRTCSTCRCHQACSPKWSGPVAVAVVVTLNDRGGCAFPRSDSSGQFPCAFAR
jgi:hypothetical protein